MVRPSVATTFALAVLALLGLMAVGLTQRARSQVKPQATQRQTQPQAAVQVPTRRLQPIKSVAPAPRPVRYSVLKVRGNVQLRSKPRGKVLAAVGPSTQFGSPTTLTVAARRGDWVGVTSTDLPNGKLGWVKAKGGPLAGHRTRMAIRIDLSRKRLQLLAGRRVVRTATVGIGRPGSPTPTGRYSITDKLPGSRYGSYYGC